MNANFKPLGLAAAVATATAGYAGITNAQSASYAADTELGDLAIVPYYTVMDGYATGVNIINTSERTQVIKFRFRRAADSMDALDFSVVLSPKDMYTGFLALEGDDITFTSNDNSCTAPAMSGNKFTMPAIYRNGAETGYIEIISMGSPISETQPIAVAAKHNSAGVPASCDDVRDNFFANPGSKGNTPENTKRGVHNSAMTAQTTGAAAKLEVSYYDASPDSLKVSYFIKDDNTGVEFGDNAVHIAGFMSGASMTNQQQGVFSGDLQGFDHPDLNGGAPADAIFAPTSSTPRGRYNELRNVLSAAELINDWSANEAGNFSVDTDWVVTFPGQYVMLDLPVYLASLVDDDVACLRDGLAQLVSATPCDWRDIPVDATITVYDREEQEVTIEEGDLVVSPQPPVLVERLSLDDEVNVIEWGAAPVLQAPKVINNLEVPEGAMFGWASLVGTPQEDPALCDFNVPNILANLGDQGTRDEYTCGDVAIEGSVPVVGFVAWQRNFAALPEGNYGRIVEHSRVQSAQ